MVTACSETVDPNLERLRGFNSLAEQRYDRARIHFAADLESHPSRRESLRGLAIAWTHGIDQAMVPAMKALRAYLAVEPSDAELRKTLVRQLLQLGSWQEALEQARLLDHDPESRRLRARALLEITPEEARAEIEAAVRDDPADAATRVVAADIAIALDRADEARRQLLVLRDLDPLRADAYYRLGRLLLLAGEREASQRTMAIYRDLTELDEANTLSAIEQLRLLRQLEAGIPADHPVVVRRRTALRLEAGFVEEALVDLESLAEGDHLSDADKLEIASRLARRDRPEEAGQLYRQVLAKSPDNRGARTGLVQLLLATGNLPYARELLEDGLALEPGLARYRFLSGRLSCLEGDAEECAQQLAEAVESAPFKVDWRLELADQLLASGKRQEATDLIVEAPEEHPALERFTSERGIAGDLR